MSFVKLIHSSDVPLLTMHLWACQIFLWWKTTGNLQIVDVKLEIWKNLCLGLLILPKTGSVLFQISNELRMKILNLASTVRHIPWTELYVRSTSVLCKKKLCYKLSEDDKLLRSENGFIETFLWKRNGQKLCFLLFLMQF